MAAGIIRAVRVMDGRNRQRFRTDEVMLTEWIGASTVLGRPSRRASPESPGEVPPAGDVRPAA